jgi:hypothetical protein
MLLFVKLCPKSVRSQRTAQKGGLQLEVIVVSIGEDEDFRRKYIQKP